MDDPPSSIARAGPRKGASDVPSAPPSPPHVGAPCHPPPRRRSFYPFRALGYVSEGAPFAVQRRGTETFVTVSAGKAWQIYNCDKLRLVMVGPQFGDAPDIARSRPRAISRSRPWVATWRCVADRTACAPSRATPNPSRTSSFSAATSSASAPAGASSRGTSPRTPWTTSTASAAPRAERQSRVQGDDPDDSDDDESDSDDSKSSSDQRSPDPASSRSRTASSPRRCAARTPPEQDFARRRDGRLCLLNVKTGSVIHVFEPDAMGNRSGASVTCLENSPALDTVAVGLSDGRVVVHKAATTSRLSTLRTPTVRKPVRSCAFSTGQGEPVLAVAGDSGTVSVWSLEKRRLRTLVTGAHGRRRRRRRYVLLRVADL